MTASCVSALSERRSEGSEIEVVHIEAHHLAERMHAGIGAPGARRLHIALEQQSQSVFKIALHGQLPRLPGEPGERRAVVGERERKRVLADGFVGNGRMRVIALARCVGRGNGCHGMRIHSP